ncbi:MAG TPA: hypothetical protein PKH80_07295 [Methanofastidiosum sp.]|nr:hypothetical protein [Methanofastidiosum sp.]
MPGLRHRAALLQDMRQHDKASGGAQLHLPRLLFKSWEEGIRA